MQSAKSKRDKQLTVACTQNEFATLKSKYQASASKSFSDYLRRLLLNRPVRIDYHDKSLDNLLDHLVEIRALTESLLEHSSFSAEVQKELSMLYADIKQIISQIADHVCKD